MKAILFPGITRRTALIVYPQGVCVHAYGAQWFNGGFGLNYVVTASLVGKIDNNQLNAAFTYMMKAGKCFEVQYLHQTTGVPSTYQLAVFSQTKSETPTLSYHIFKFGSDRQLPPMSR